MSEDQQRMGDMDAPLRQYLEARLAVLQRQKREMTGPITDGYHSLAGQIGELQHVLAASRALSDEAPF